MGLPIKLPFLNKKVKVEYYLALLLRDEKVTALVFEQSAGNIKVISKHEEELKSILETTPLEDLVNIIDTTISKAEEKLPTNIEVKETVFGVKDTWVEEKKIRKEYLAKLKHACEQLSLTPIGFIVLSEAIAHLIREEEGTPVTALLTEVGKYMVTVSLFRAGKLIETKNKEITTTAMHAVDDALKEFEQVEILPSRIILFHSILQSEAHAKDELTQKFIAHQWSKSLPFLHVPQISILPQGFDGKAIVAGAASQLGFSLSGIIHAEEAAEIKTIESTKATGYEINKNKKEIAQEIIENEEEDKKVVDEPESNETAEDFGFILDKDVAEVGPAVASVGKAKKTIHSDSLSDFNELPEANNEKEEVEKKEHEQSFEKANENKNFVIHSNSSKNTSKSKINMPEFLTIIPTKLKNLHLPRFAGNKSLLFIPPAFILVLIGAVLAYLFFVKASVTIFISPEATSETQKITLSTEKDNDFSQNLIAIKEVTISLEGSASTEATGEKEVGEKAKGTITIYNSDNSKKTFSEGTEVTSEKGLIYTLDKEVSVASASGDIFSGIKSGTVQVSVTASKIGTEYNLPSNSKFSLENANDVAAKNESAFSGGSKKKVTVVTKKDVEKITEDLPKTLEQKAKEELQKKLSSEEVLLSDFTNQELSKEKLDKEVDSEAKTVKLTGTVTFKSVAYQKNDLENYAKTLIKAEYPEAEISDNQITFKISGLKSTDDKNISGVLEINAGLLPKINTENIKKSVTGKSFTQTQEEAKTISKQINNVEIKLSPNLPFLPKTMPRRAENISVSVQASD